METVVKSTQEQAVSAWIGFLNQLRFNELIDRLNMQDINLEDALGELCKLKEFLGDPASILGSAKTKHGEIAENVQVYFSNARRAIEGLSKEYSFDGVGRTAPEDYIKNGAPVQSKFFINLKSTLNGNGNANGILQHIKMYPDFVTNGGSYDIPKDQYDEMIRLLNLRDQKPTLLTKSELRILKAIDLFEKESGLSVRKDIHPAVVEYNAVKQGKIHETVRKEEDSIKQKDQSIRDEAFQKSKPSAKEAGKATAIGALAEGGITFCLGVAKKRKEGKQLLDFTGEDWRELGIETGGGTVKGAIRGAGVYILSNFTETKENIASAFITAVLGIAAQANALRKGKITNEDFIINSETLCLDVTISAIASLLGTLAIKEAVLGAIIGNTAGMFMYEIVKYLDLEREKKIISNHQAQLNELQKKLDDQYREFITLLEEKIKKFNSLVDLAFSQEQNNAFSASIELAYFSGVADNKILKTKSDIDAFFLT